MVLKWINDSSIISARCGCLVAEDIGVHQLERLVELLAPSECEDLLVALSNSEEETTQRIVKRDTSSLEGQHSNALTSKEIELFSVARPSLGMTSR